jgi:hypothetical protein
MKNAVFWYVAPCRYFVNRRFGGTYRFDLYGRKIYERKTSVSSLAADGVTSQKTAFFTKQDVLGNTIPLLSFGMTWTAYKTKKKNRGDGHTDSKVIL